ncbi:MAG: amino acid racemase, partial [Patescibacteria group bacterium]|jgi:aspartate racemase|nr:amino acid racemase [Patescibacteria group bacterium]
MIGILGGMGPAASASVYEKIIELAQKNYKAEQDTDYPPMMLYNLPLMGFDETGFIEPALVKKQLIEGVKKLEKAGSNFVIIACNTVHFFYDDIQKAVNVPVINLLGKAVARAHESGFKKIGLLSSESTKKLHLYRNIATENNIKIIETTNKEQELVNDVILKVMSGDEGLAEKKILKRIIKRMKSVGAEAIVLGCTELPIALNKKDIVPFPLFDTISIAAEEALKKSYSQSS